MTRKEGDAYPRKGFWALIITQFQGAFNDQLFQNVIVFFLLAEFASLDGGGKVERFGITFTPGDYVPSLATFIFSMPFILFAAFFGALADRFSKGVIARSVKYLEVVIMTLGALAFYYASPVSTWGVIFLFFMLFMMAVHSTMFGPAKYGLLPEILPESRLSWGNGILQMGTIVAIIAGTGLAGPLFKFLSERGEVYYISFFLITLSFIGLFSAQFISRPPAANPSQHIPRNPLNPWEGMGTYLKVIYQDGVLLNVVLGYTYFWFAGALVRQTVVKYSVTLHHTEDLTAILLAAMALGIGIGAVLAGYLSRGKIEQGFVPIGALGMALSAVLIAVPASFHERITLPIAGWVLSPLPLEHLGPLTAWGEQVGAYFVLLSFLLFWLGAFAGFFDVPLAATLQQRAPDAMKGGIISATNMLTFVGMAAASVLFLAMGGLGLNPNQVFLTTGVVTLGVGFYMIRKIPLLALRALLWLLDGTLFRLLVSGRNHLPERGGALLVSDHYSIIDTLAIQAASDREICFVLEKEALSVPFIRRLAHYLHLIPVDSLSEEGLAEGVQKIEAALREGYVVCITRDRRMRPDGLETPWYQNYFILTKNTGVSAFPVSMTRLWERVYIFKDRVLQWRWWGRLRYPVQVYFGAALSPDLTGDAVRQAVEHLAMEAYQERPYQFNTLQEGFVVMARRNLRRIAFADVMSGSLDYFKALVGAIVFARKLRPLLGDNPMIGLLIPPTIGGALANIAVQMMGRTPINLNYTASAETIHSCAERAGVTHVLTSKKFLERLPLQVPGTPIYLEDIKDSVTGKDRLIGMLMALCLPKKVLLRKLGSTSFTGNELATIIFSSGSEGEPKGIMLTHRNVITIMESAQEIFPHHKDSCLVSFLPIFHSFGYTVCLWTPILAGLRAVFHPNPLEPKAIGGLIQKYGGSIMIGTATFLQGFIRRCDSEQLRSLDYVVCGAEKLPERIRKAFMEKFGVEPVEGYGTTECAPAVSLNIPDCDSPGFYVKGLRHGTIGRTMTGQTVRVVDPDTGEELPTGEAGLLLVKGPNVMQGYLKDKERTEKVLKDGWYATGDIAAVDSDRFISITDRLARFSKIAGEMVPHTKVEESLHSLLSLTEQSMIVASVPDVAKGERLVVLHTLTDEQLDELFKKLNDSELPNLWRPRSTSFYRIEAIPVLGTGKMDLKKAKKMALALDIGE